MNVNRLQLLKGIIDLLLCDEQASSSNGLNPSGGKTHQRFTFPLLCFVTAQQSMGLTDRHLTSSVSVQSKGRYSYSYNLHNLQTLL